MLFKTKHADATWDTWMYWYEGKFYLYYLITEYSPGEGFGVATSANGVHWTDHGKQLGASDDMVFYLGTGSVWALPKGAAHSFACNYSEWRETAGGKVQNILFATSDDLIHWEKCGDALMFRPDDRYYRVYEQDGARWDCIYTLPKADGGYWGTWTATPKDRMGVGFGESDDGLNWRAMVPPQIDLTPFGGKAVESGAVTVHGGRYYLMVGCYDHPSGMGVFVADHPLGPYSAQRHSFALLSNNENMHAYFARFLELPNETLVNFHQLTREVNAHNRPYTYLTPLKAVDYDDQGTLRLKWWQGNDALVGADVGLGANRLVMDCLVQGAGELRIRCDNKQERQILVRENGAVAVADEHGHTLECADRSLPGADCFQLRLLVRDAFIEVYLNNYFMLCYTLPGRSVWIDTCNTGLIFCRALKLDHDAKDNEIEVDSN